LIKQETGHPFFPYTLWKDGVVASLVLLIIILMAIFLGAELGPKADPTTTTYVPRPVWYFFVHFELLRVVKPPELVFIATIGIPTLCLVLLLLLPFIDRNAERHPLKRPIATVTGIAVILAMGYLTIEGALAGAPTEIDLATAPQYESGRSVVAASGCLGCHRIGENGNSGPGPELTDIGDRLRAPAIRRTLLNPTAPMPSYQGLSEKNPKQFNELVAYLASLR
jgi:ubiquinol-cytochrome c reductase cytochrome b subunit/menaquinol-cytochrome c reductase cytochrome b/c subunit